MLSRPRDGNRGSIDENTRRSLFNQKSYHMKTKLFSLFAILLITQAAMAQFHIGIKGGANITKVDGKSFKDEFRYGYHLGGFVEIRAGNKFVIQPEVLWNQYATRLDSNYKNVYEDVFNGNANVKLNYLSIPILVNYKLIGSFLSLQAGPQFGILLDLLASPVRDACRRWCVGSLALGFAAIFLSQSRAAFWVFVWAFWLVAAYWSQTLARINLRAVATVGLAGLVLAASTAWLPRDPLRLREGWTEVAGAMRDGNYNTSMGARLYNWSLGWESFKESPWVGIGGRERLKRIKSAGMDLPPDQRARFQEVRNVGHVHNQYLHAAMDGGLIGLASTLTVLAGLGASAWRLRRVDPVASRQMQGVLFMHATAGLSNVNMAHNFYAIMLSLSVAVILIGAGARAGGPEPAPVA